MKFGVWTKITDALPPEPDKSTYNKAQYLCTTANGFVVPMEYVKTTVRGKPVLRWEWYGRISPWEVIAWMPFPEPYKE